MSFSISFIKNNKLIVSSDKRITKISSNSYSDNNNKIEQFNNSIVGVGAGMQELNQLVFDEFRKQLKEKDDWIKLDKELSKFFEDNFRRTYISNQSYQHFRKSQIVIAGKYQNDFYILYISSIPTNTEKGIVKSFYPIRCSDDATVPIGSNNKNMIYAQNYIGNLKPEDKIIDELKKLYKNISNNDNMVSSNFDVAEFSARGYKIKTIINK